MHTCFLDQSATLLKLLLCSYPWCCTLKGYCWHLKGLHLTFTSWKVKLEFFWNFLICNPWSNPLHPCSFMVCFYFLAFFYQVSKLLFSDFLHFKGNFVDGQNKSNNLLWLSFFKVGTHNGTSPCSKSLGQVPPCELVTFASKSSCRDQL